MTILVTGANGQLGNEMRLVSQASLHTFVFTFGGDPYNTPYKEDQKGTPTGTYGRTNTATSFPVPLPVRPIQY